MEELIKGFRVTISNILLYPPGSRLIEESLSVCYKILSAQLKNQKSLTISESEGKLLANEKLIEVNGGIFLDSIDACKIRSITFEPRLTQKELYDLLRNLAVQKKL